MNETLKLVNLNVSNNSNLSFSLVKSEKLVSFCKENKIKSASVCDYQHFDFVNFYFLCKQNKISPIWGIKKTLVYKKKPFFISFFPTTYPNYRFINHLFYNNKIGKTVDFNFLFENFEILSSKCLFVFEVRSFFDFEEASRIKTILDAKSQEELVIYIGLNFIPKVKKIEQLFESNSPILPFYSIKCFSEYEKDYLLKFRSLDMKSLGEFKNEDFNQNYFHYLTYKDLEFMIGDNSFVKKSYKNLCDFISKIKISIKVSSGENKDSDFLEIEKICNENLSFLNVQEKFKYEKILVEELNLIRKKNYSTYFNNIRSITESFRKSGIEVGPGRGSSVSSLVSYLTGITKIDPVKNNLYFWRFLNEKRDDFPDIDIDVNDQENAFKVLIKDFGRDYISKISTRKSIGLTNLINISLNSFDIQQDEKNFILKNLDFIPKFFRENQSNFKALRLKAIFERNNFYFEFLKKFQKLIVGLSSHPSGIIISNSKKLSRILPINFIENSNNKEILTCSYPSSSLEKLGFKKFDFLSLNESLNFVNFMKKKFPEICPYEKINFSDSKTWNLLNNCLVSHVFQLDSKISRQSLLKISPFCFNDLTLLISLNRPGVTNFARNEKNNSLSSSISSKFISEILSSTQGNILFEEQVSMIISFCTSLDIYQSELIRKDIKKISQEGKSFEEFREKFFQKSSRRVALEDQKIIFEKIVESAPYMFNKAHAVSYSYLTYYVSYIKANYFEDSTKYFLEKTNTNNRKLFLTFSEIFLQGYEIFKPDINSSNYENIFSNKKFILGFSCLSGNNSSVFEKIVENRDKFGKYSSLRDFIDRNTSIFSNYKFENFLPWIETGIFRSLNFDSSLIIENFDFFSRYIDIKKTIFLGSEIPFLNKFGISSQKKSLKNLNEKEISSFNCYVSYFGRWNQVSKDKKLKIFSLQSALKKNFKYYGSIKVYSVIFDIKKLKNSFLLFLYDVNSIFEVSISQKEFEKYKNYIDLNNELIFDLEVFNEDVLNFSANVKKVSEV